MNKELLESRKGRCCPFCKQPVSNAVTDEQLLEWSQQEGRAMVDSMSESDEEPLSFWESGEVN